MLLSTKLRHLMTDYTIDQFWIPRLARARQIDTSLVPGWRFVTSGLDTFQEAPLRLNSDLGDGPHPQRTPLFLVSAPGAVGKSTLARQIAYRTNAVYVDLSTAGPVGDNTLTGALVKSNLLKGWHDGDVALLIDGLDEAMLRVTHDAFEAFLRDVAQLATSRQLPTVLFGRTAAVEHAWLALTDASLEPAVLEIGYYDQPTALKFVRASVRHSCPDDPHISVRQSASKLLLSQLLDQTHHDGNRFAGYAPVLNAVVERVVRERNPSALMSHVSSDVASGTLQSVVHAILDREHSKLTQIDFEDAKLPKELYLPTEQLDRLVALRYGTAPPPFTSLASNNDRARYEGALESWLPEHPFLSGTHDSSPSAVFDAVITGHALGNPAAEAAATSRELEREANPFLSAFYPKALDTAEAASDLVDLPAGHIGIVYSSVRARLTLSQAASLLVDGREDRMEAEISIRDNDDDRSERTVLKLRSDSAGTLRFGSEVADAEINLPKGRVDIDATRQATLVAPIDLDCADLRVRTGKFVVDASPKEGYAAAVTLRAATADVVISGTPILRRKAALFVSWPQARSYPWSGFTSPKDVVPLDDQRIAERLRRLRRLVTAFRARGKTQLARIVDKIDSPRMMKGSGQAVLNALMDRGIVSRDERKYVLDPDALGRVVGVNYIDCARHDFPESVVAFVRQITDPAP